MDDNEAIDFLQASYPGVTAEAQSRLTASRFTPGERVRQCKVAIMLPDWTQYHGGGETFNEAVSDLMAKCPPRSLPVVVMEGGMAA